MAVTSTVETITPQKAVEYLQHNTDNYRKLSSSIVRGYAEDIRNGKWQLNGDTIVFSEDGKLKNGQHRLAGIVLAKKPIQCVVVRGVDNSVDIFDVGSKRTVNQMVTNRGIDIPSLAISAARIVLNRFEYYSSKGVECNYVARNNSELGRAYRCTCQGSGQSNLSKKAACVAATYLMLRSETMHSYEIQLFYQIFNTGDDTGSDGYESSPALVARRMFEKRYHGATARMSQKEQLEIIIMAMEDFHSGKPRQNNYRVTMPFHFEKYMKQVRELDGIDH